jgi:hypothetical protein
MCDDCTILLLPSPFIGFDLTHYFSLTMIVKLTALATILSASDAFMVNQQQQSARCPTTRLFLEDHIADMIDMELQRLAHKQEADRAWHQKNEAVIEHDLPQGFDFDEAESAIMARRQKKKDKRLAKQDPQRYCADRCIATGNCDVFEDIFDFTAEEVVKFCEECVISDEEEPCVVPEALFEDDVGHDSRSLKP